MDRSEPVRITPTDTDDHVDTQAWDMIKQLQKEGAPNLLHKIIELYFDNSSKLISTMKESLAANDPEGLHRAAHSLKSNSRYLGAFPLGDLCQQLEAMSKSQRITAQSGTLLTEIEREYAKAVPVLMTELKSGEGELSRNV
jgi:HPt (histidine-containing phosphotransfer) domain-containing protein